MAPLLSQHSDMTPHNAGRLWFDSLDFDSQVEAIAGVASSPQGMEVVRGLMWRGVVGGMMAPCIGRNVTCPIFWLGGNSV